MEQLQPPQTNKGILLLPKDSVSALVCLTIGHILLLILIQKSWVIGCSISLYLISVLLLFCNAKIQNLSENHTLEVRKWRRLCTVFLCLLVMVFPVTIYYANTEHWFKVKIFADSGILLLLIVVLHVTLVERSEVKG
jgi:hypothetical protein